MFHVKVSRVFSLLPPTFCKTFPLQSSSPSNKSCFSAKNSVSFVASRGNFFSFPPGLPHIAQKWCNPYHRVEFCGVNPSADSSFHKVINIHVQNFTALKYFLLHFGILRATTPPVSLLTRSIRSATFLTQAQDDSSPGHGFHIV